MTLPFYGAVPGAEIIAVWRAPDGGAPGPRFGLPLFHSSAQKTSEVIKMLNKLGNLQSHQYCVCVYVHIYIYIYICFHLNCLLCHTNLKIIEVRSE